MRAIIKPGKLPDAPKPTRAYHEVKRSFPPIMSSVEHSRRKGQKAFLEHPKVKRQLLSEHEKQQIIDFRQKGKTYKEIGDLIGREKTTVSKYYSRYLKSEK